MEVTVCECSFDGTPVSGLGQSRKAQCEHKVSAVTPATDIAQQGQHAPTTTKSSGAASDWQDHENHGVSEP
jgi:hypothetical protein